MSHEHINKMQGDGKKSISRVFQTHVEFEVIPQSDGTDKNHNHPQQRR